MGQLTTKLKIPRGLQWCLYPSHELVKINYEEILLFSLNFRVEFLIFQLFFYNNELS